MAAAGAALSNSKTKKRANITQRILFAVYSMKDLAAAKIMRTEMNMSKIASG
jgi:hypothetical protein